MSLESYFTNETLAVVQAILEESNSPSFDIGNTFTIVNQSPFPVQSNSFSKVEVIYNLTDNAIMPTCDTNRKKSENKKQITKRKRKISIIENEPEVKILKTYSKKKPLVEAALTPFPNLNTTSTNKNRIPLIEKYPEPNNNRVPLIQNPVNLEKPKSDPDSGQTIPQVKNLPSWKLEELEELVNIFSGLLALVTEYDKKTNDEFLEYYKTPEQITLKVNDLYCKVCMQKIDLNNTNIISYGKFVFEHFKTEQHIIKVEKQQQKEKEKSDCENRKPLMRPATLPPKKIITSLQPDNADLQQLARTFIDLKLPFSECDGAHRLITLGAIHRRVSPETLINYVDSLAIKGKK